jgi:hypothetical protein
MICLMPGIFPRILEPAKGAAASGLTQKLGLVLWRVFWQGSGQRAGLGAECWPKKRMSSALALGPWGSV